MQKFTLLSIKNLQNVFLHNRFGLTETYFIMFETSNDHPLIGCREYGGAFKVPQKEPYKSYRLIRRYLSKYALHLRYASETHIHKYDFWKTYIRLNMPYSYHAYYWFLRLYSKYLRNAIGPFTAFDYLNRIWAQANIGVNFSEIRFLENAAKIYLTDYVQNLDKPSPFCLPPNAMVRVSKITFTFGVNQPWISLLHVWHALFMKNLERKNKENPEPWIPYTKWQVPSVYPFSRETKDEVQSLKHGHYQRVWRWKLRQYQLIVLDRHNRRVSDVWTKFNPTFRIYER
jgi:hypothetical protein